MIWAFSKINRLSILIRLVGLIPAAVCEFGLIPVSVCEFDLIPVSICEFDLIPVAVCKFKHFSHLVASLTLIAFNYFTLLWLSYKFLHLIILFIKNLFSELIDILLYKYICMPVCIYLPIIFVLFFQKLVTRLYADSRAWIINLMVCLIKLRCLI